LTRVRGGYTTRRRHKKLLKLTKGHRGTKHALYRRAHESMLHSLAYAYRDRKDRKGEFRKLWIARINAAARIEGMSYSTLMHGLKKAEIDINRKMLADMAIADPAAFAKIVELAKAQAA